MHHAQFSVYLKVFPIEGNRYELMRDLHDLSAVIYSKIAEIPGVQLAQPGGGPSNALGEKAFAVKPRFGDFPAQIVLSGFIEQSGSGATSYGTKTVISGNQWWTIPATEPTAPGSTEAGEAATLRLAIENALSTINAPIEVYKFNYKGLYWVKPRIPAEIIQENVRIVVE